MKVPYKRQHLEHLLGGLRGVPPALSAEGDLGDLLPRAEAVVDRATPKTLVPEACVSSATEVRLQVRTSLPGGFVDREVRRGREGRCDAAQREAALAVSVKTDATCFEGGLCVLALHGFHSPRAGANPSVDSRSPLRVSTRQPAQRHLFRRSLGGDK